MVSSAFNIGDNCESCGCAANWTPIVEEQNTGKYGLETIQFNETKQGCI